MMKDGRPYSNENGWIDDALITDESEFVQKIVRAWIVANIYPCKKSGDYHTSYGIKHILEGDTGIYLTNNQFKDAMLLAGFEPVNPDELNWTYRIKTSSPAFQCDEDECGIYGVAHKKHGLSCAVLFDEIRRIYTEEWEREREAARSADEQTDAKPLEAPPPWDDVPMSEAIPPTNTPTPDDMPPWDYVPPDDTPLDMSTMKAPQPEDLLWDDVPPDVSTVPSMDSAPLSVDWKALCEQCGERLPPMYCTFLNQCAGATLNDGTLTIYAQDFVTIGRLNNVRVKDVLQDLSGARHVTFAVICIELNK